MYAKRKQRRQIGTEKKTGRERSESAPDPITLRIHKQEQDEGTELAGRCG